METIEDSPRLSCASRPKRQIVLLDIIRFVAASLVLAFHAGFWSFLNRPGGWHTAIAPFARIGWIGVPIFFVLSGFVIAYSAEEQHPPAF